MRTLILVTIASIATLIEATPGGAHNGIVLSGPSGIVTSKGPIGPAALGLDGFGAYGGHAGLFAGGLAGPFAGGLAGSSAFLSGAAGHSALSGNPALSYSSLLGPAAGFPGAGLGLGGHGLGFGAGALGGFGAYGGYGASGLGLAPGVTVTNGGGTVSVGHSGVVVKGPPTVPATIAGPAGKVVANGLYGVPNAGHGW